MNEHAKFGDFQYDEEDKEEKVKEDKEEDDKGEDKDKDKSIKCYTLLCLNHKLQ